MGRASRDDNSVTTLIGVSSADTSTPTLVAVDPATNRLLVNATITGGAGDGSILDGVTTTIKATVFDYTNSNPLGVVLRDTNGDYVSVGGGTQYTEDAVAAADPVGTALNLIRDDARGGSLTTTDGDNVAARGTNAGELYVKHVDSIPVTGTFWQATQPVSIAASVAVTNAGLTELAAAINASSQMDVNIAASGATVPVSGTFWQATQPVSLASVPSHAVTNAGTFAVQADSVIPGTGATNLGKAEDAGHASGDVGVMSLGVRNDTPNAALAGTDLDYSPIALYRTGAVRVAPPEEDFAALGSNSVKKYYTNVGAVTDGIVWSPAAGKRWYVTDIFINVSAAATVTLEDDLAAGDSAVWKAELAANSGWSHSFSTPLFSGEDAADLIVTTSAATIYIMVTGYEI